MDVIDHPHIVHEDPYDKGWLFIAEPFIPERDMKILISGDQSVSWIEQENRKLLGILGDEYEKLAATGGEPVRDIFGQFPDADWQRLVREFLHTGLE